MCTYFKQKCEYELSFLYKQFNENGGTYFIVGQSKKIVLHTNSQ